MPHAAHTQKQEQGGGPASFWLGKDPERTTDIIKPQSVCRIKSCNIHSFRITVQPLVSGSEAHLQLHEFKHGKNVTLTLKWVTDRCKKCWNETYCWVLNAVYNLFSLPQTFSCKSVSIFVTVPLSLFHVDILSKGTSPSFCFYHVAGAQLEPRGSNASL